MWLHISIMLYFLSDTTSRDKGTFVNIILKMQAFASLSHIGMFLQNLSSQIDWKHQQITIHTFFGILGNNLYIFSATFSFELQYYKLCFLLTVEVEKVLEPGNLVPRNCLVRNI